jgi:hypothetical protein
LATTAKALRALDRTPQAVRVKAVEIGVRLRPPKMEHRRIKLSVQAWRALQTEADLKDLETQSIMIKLANDYDKLADRAEERASRDKTPGPSPMPKQLDQTNPGWGQTRAVGRWTILKARPSALSPVRSIKVVAALTTEYSWQSHAPILVIYPAPRRLGALQLHHGSPSLKCRQALARPRGGDAGAVRRDGTSRIWPQRIFRKRSNPSK